jgi:hypothetical protein
MADHLLRKKSKVFEAERTSQLRRAHYKQLEQEGFMVSHDTLRRSVNTQLYTHIPIQPYHIRTQITMGFTVLTILVFMVWKDRR